MIKGFSKKQLELMSWWCPQSSLSGCDGIICDGAQRQDAVHGALLLFVEHGAL